MKTFAAIFSSDIVTTDETKISKISKKQINSYDDKDVI